MATTDAYDNALTALSGTGPEYDGWHTNLGAVAADALIALGRTHAVSPWIQGYRRRLEEPPPVGQLITRNSWQPALGDPKRSSDWVKFFRQELQQSAWPVVLKDWLPRLAPGLSGAGGVGFIRTAYALHQLDLEDTGPRRDELAEGLAYWASRHLKLPGLMGRAATGAMPPAEALSHIKWQHKGHSPDFKSLSDGLVGLKGFPAFGGVINLAEIPAKPMIFISRITECFARVILSHSELGQDLSPFTQAMILPSALRYVIPHLNPDETLASLRYGWQFAGAIYAIYGQTNPVDKVAAPSGDMESLIDQTVASANERIIIFTEVCLREYIQTPKPVYLTAAWRVLEQLAPPSTSDGDTPNESSH